MGRRHSALLRVYESTTNDVGFHLVLRRDDVTRSPRVLDADQLRLFRYKHSRFPHLYMYC